MPSSIHMERKGLRRQRANDDLRFDNEPEEDAGAAVGILAGIVFSAATWLALAAAVSWLALH